MKVMFSIAAALLVALAWLVHATGTARAPEPTPTTTSTTSSTTSSDPATRARPRASRLETPAPRAPELVEAAPHEEADLSIRGQRARLEERFSTETTDAGWAIAAQQELHADLGRFATRDVAIDGVTCRASMCRIELALATRDAASTFMESWLRKRTWSGPGLADNDVIGADGQPRLVLFVGREGVEL